MAFRRIGFKRGSGFTFKGYCPKNSKVIEPLKKMLLWAFAKNGGERFVMSIKTMQRLLLENYNVEACRRTVCYGLKYLVKAGFITRQSRWIKRKVDGAIQRARSVTRAQGHLLIEQLQRGMRGLKLAAVTRYPVGEKTVQIIALGYYKYLKNVVPQPE